MADIIKDSYVETNNFSKVLFQRGRDVCDFELNELQDILRVFMFRQFINGTMENPADALNPGSNDDGYLVTGTGAANQVTLGAGFIFCDGIPIEKAVSSALTGFTTPAGADRTDVVYLAVTEAEVTDPAQIAALGETTRRRQLQVTVAISTTGLGGVPANTGTEIWEGGIHYFPIASIERFDGVATINASDVTDLRYRLPPTILSQMTRQEDGVVAAVVGSIFETPDGTLVDTSSTMSFDVDPRHNHAGVRSILWTWARDNFANFRVPMHLDETTAVTGKTAALVLDTNTVLFNETALSFSDSNLAGAAATKYVALSESTAGANRLRIGELEAGTVSGTVTGTTSIMRALNGRAEVTCGDGTSTFGDFNGVNALRDAVNYLTAANAHAKIYLKPGVYDANAIAWDADRHLEIIGIPGGLNASPLAPVTIRNMGGAADTASIVATSPGGTVQRLTIRGVTFTKGSTGQVAIDSTHVAVYLHDCRMVNQVLDLEMIGTKMYALYAERSQIELDATVARSAVRITYTAGTATTGGVCMQDCEIQVMDGGACVEVISNSGSVQATQYQFTRCNLFVGELTLNGSDNPSHACGVLFCTYSGTGSVLFRNIEFKDCNVSNTTTVVDNMVLLYFRSADGSGATFTAQRFRISGGRWVVTGPGSGSTWGTDLTPIYIGGETWDDPGVDNLEVSNVTFGFDDVIGSGSYGTYAPEVGWTNVAEWGAVFLSAVSTLSMRNVNWINPYPRSGCGEFVLFGGKQINVDGVEISGAWLDNNNNGTPESRFRVITESGEAPLRVAHIRNVHIGGSISSATGSDGIIVVKPGTPIVLEGCSIYGFQGGSDNAIRIDATSSDYAAGVTIRGCRIDSMAGDGIRYDHSGAANLAYLLNVVIESNLINNCASYGIYLNGASGVDPAPFRDLHIRGNTVTGCGNNGIRVSPGVWDSADYGIQISNNVCHDNISADGVQIQIGGGGTASAANAGGVVLGNICGGSAGTLGQIRFHTAAPSLMVGSETGYSTTPDPTKFGDRSHTSGDRMMHNLARLLIS